jgi:RNA polymerase sigma-70 factor (ECF subfamily)
VLDVDALYREHHLAVERYLLLRSGGDRQFAEDLAQEVWLRVFRFAASYEDRGKPVLAWLFTIARNAVIDHARERRQVEAVSMERVGELGEPAEDGAVERERTLELEGYLDRLRPLQAAVIQARFLVGLSVRETSAAVGGTEEGVKKVQARALVNLRRMMEEAAA